MCEAQNDQCTIFNLSKPINQPIRFLLAHWEAIWLLPVICRSMGNKSRLGEECATCFKNPFANQMAAKGLGADLKYQPDSNIEKN